MESSRTAISRSRTYWLDAGDGFYNPAWGSVPNYHEYGYDESGRMTSDRMRSGLTIQNTVTYLPDGLDVLTIDMVNRRTRRRTNMAGDLTRVDEYVGVSTVYATTTYVWDQLDRLVWIHDALDDTSDTTDDIRITYDMASQKRKMIDPASGTWFYTYDPAGNLQTQTDPRGQVLAFEWLLGLASAALVLPAPGPRCYSSRLMVFS